MLGWVAGQLPQPLEMRIWYQGSPLIVILEAAPWATRPGHEECFCCHVSVAGIGLQYHAAVFSIGVEAVLDWVRIHGVEPDPERVLAWYKGRVKDHFAAIMQSPDLDTSRWFCRKFTKEETAGASLGPDGAPLRR